MSELQHQGLSTPATRMRVQSSRSAAFSREGNGDASFGKETMLFFEQGERNDAAGEGGRLPTIGWI